MSPKVFEYPKKPRARGRSVRKRRSSPPIPFGHAHGNIARCKKRGPHAGNNHDPICYVHETQGSTLACYSATIPRASQAQRLSARSAGHAPAPSKEEPCSPSPPRPTCSPRRRSPPRGGGTSSYPRSRISGGFSLRSAAGRPSDNPGAFFYASTASARRLESAHEPFRNRQRPGPTHTLRSNAPPRVLSPRTCPPATQAPSARDHDASCPSGSNPPARKDRP